MEKEWIAIARVACKLPETVTDEEFNLREAELRKSPHTIDSIRVANFIELRTLKQSSIPECPQMGLFPSGYDLLWQGRCERMFIEGFYGPCCVWARATVELLLQEMCLLDPGASVRFRGWVRRHKGKNPGIDECMGWIVESFSSDDCRACATIKDNGDWVAHNRIDKISGDESLEDVLRGWGVSEEHLNRPGFKTQERLLRIANRHDKERGLALSSMKALYSFLSRRTPPQLSLTP